MTFNAIAERGSPPSRKGLTKEQAKEIFRLKFSLYTQGIDPISVSKQYKISTKTVHDIWSGRTWYRETLELDPFRPDAQERLRKKVGRPRGAKDSKPRTCKKSFANQELSITNSMGELMFVDSDSGIPDSISDDLHIQEEQKISFDPEMVRESPGNFVDPFHNDWPHW